MISIIVPVYNLATKIEACIKSIIEQTYFDIEIIIVDDGSTDNSREIIENLSRSDVRIKSIFKDNGGVTSARLAGVKVATGEWIGFVDGDDEIEPSMFEFLLNNAKKHNAQISHCGYQMVFPDGRVNYFYDTGRLVQQDRITGLKDLLSGSFVEPGLCNKLFHKSLFHSLLHENVMDFSIKINEDLLMNYYLFKSADKSVYEDQCPYHYMVRYTSVSRQKLNYNKIFDPIKVKKIILNDCPDTLKKDALSAYLGTCVNIYNGLTSESLFKHKAEKRKVSFILKEHRKDLINLSSRNGWLAKLICYVPWIYNILYWIYAHLFQKKRYE